MNRFKAMKFYRNQTMLLKAIIIFLHLSTIFCLSPILLFANNKKPLMEQIFQDIKKIEEEFSKSFIEAISSKSIEACADLVLSYEDNSTLEVDYGLSEKRYRKRLLEQSENFLKGQSKFIDKKNAALESAISFENFEEINTYDFEIPKKHPACFIKTISITMKKRLVDGIFYQVGFQIEDAVFVNGKIKINNLFSVRMHESFWDEINEENTPYLLIEDKASLNEILGNHSDREYAEILDHYNNWYLHTGDLVLDSYEVKVNLIVTGNLKIKEPVTEVLHELIVLGNTSLNTLFLEETNDVLFLGGIEFTVGLFIMDSGAYQIFNSPKGPIIFAQSETIEVENTQNILCLYAPELDKNGDYSEIILDEFCGKEEGNEYLEIELIIETLRAERPIFKK